MGLWICLILIGVLVLCLYRYKKQLQSMTDQLEFILKTDTNQLMTIDISSKEIKKLAEVLNQILKKHKQMDIRMKKTDQAFKQGITNLSHDLRTPLTSARGYVEMLQNEDLSEEKKKEYLKIVGERMEAVARLQDELFEYVKLEAGDDQMIREEVSLNNVLRNVLSLYYDEYVERGIEPQIEIPETDEKIIGYEEGVFRIFSNIIYNSLIHGKEPYKISIKREERWILCRFENAAPLLNQEEVNLLFDRFYTGDRSRGKRTTGLGLSIAKKLTEAMDGQIKANLTKDILCIELRWPKTFS